MSLPDFEAFRKMSLDDDLDLWDSELTLAENLENTIAHSTFLPKPQIQLPIIVAYSLIPSAMAQVLPIMVVVGVAGSGKSDLGNIIAKMYGVQTQNASTTPSALRNIINESKWHEPGLLQGERNSILIYDNVNQETLNNEYLYSLLLGGYNRNTSRVTLSLGAGKSCSFDIFGLRLLTTIHPFFNLPKYSEINRRCYVLRTKLLESMAGDDRDDLGDICISERIDPNLREFKALNRAFEQFWTTEHNLANYAGIKRSLSRQRKFLKAYPAINSHRWTISLDLVVTGLVTGVWDTFENALEHLQTYWNWHDSEMAGNISPLSNLLVEFINENTANARKLRKEVGNKVYVPIEVDAQLLKNTVEGFSKTGQLDIFPTPKVIADAMNTLGWLLKPSPTKPSTLSWQSVEDVNKKR